LKKIYPFAINKTRVGWNNCATKCFVFLNIHQISSGISKAQDGHVTRMEHVKLAYTNVIKSEERRENFQLQFE